MDTELEELESLFSEHFGRTPLNTPAGSQEVAEHITDSDDDDLPVETAVNIDERAQKYVDAILQQHDSSSSDSESEDTRTISVSSNPLQSDDPDIAKIRTFLADGCGCKGRCVSQFSEQTIYAHILDMREMTKDEKELYVMGSLNEHNTDTTKRGKKRQRTRHSLTFSGRSVCKNTYLLAYDLGKHALQKIKNHMQTQGITPRQHGNVGKKPVHALEFADIKRVVQFISNYGEEYGLPQPAAPRGRDDVPPLYLSCDMTKKKLHDLYVRSCDSDEQILRSVKYSTFCNIWNHCLPHVKIAKPRDDVCATCEKLRKRIMDSITEQEKLDTTMLMQQHIHRAQEERQFYNDCIKTAKDTNHLDDKFVHYTFDYSQNVTIPHHAYQMGPLYFLSLRKVQLFGFRNDGEPKQLNFLIDENQTIGQDGTSIHGPDAIISMIDWAIQNHGTGESECTIHADNCGAQNKNQYVLGYLMWRILTGQHEKITYSMQIPGHARCLIDGGFGMIKKLYRRCDCDNLNQLESVVNNSSRTNVAVLYPAWQWRSWKTFLSRHFKPLKGIRKYQHFTFNRTEPGIVSVQEARDSNVIQFNILKQQNHQLSRMNKPDVIPPRGLSGDRATYLYRNVRPYVRPAYQDDTCPRPH